MLSKSLISSPIISPKFIKPDLPDLGQSIPSQVNIPYKFYQLNEIYLLQERVPLTEIEQKKELHLQKQNKQPDDDSLQSGVTSTPFSKAPLKLKSSSELINISNIPIKSTQDVGLMFASAEGIIKSCSPIFPSKPTVF